MTFAADPKPMSRTSATLYAISLPLGLAALVFPASRQDRLDCRLDFHRRPCRGLRSSKKFTSPRVIVAECPMARWALRRFRRDTFPEIH